VALGGLKSRTDIKHLLIDEMQDYSPIQYKLMLKLFPCRKTILGDASQSVNPYGSSTADMIQRAFVTGEVMKLNKSYRSTYEITEFAQKIRSNNELEVVERHGNKPEIINFKNWDEEVDGIKEMVENFRRTNHQSLGIICKDEVQAAELYEKLKKYDDVYFLSHENLTFVKGITVISAHMSKGLEFDEVIVPHVDSKNYHTEIDRSMLYVAVTRAMHRLTLTYTGEVTEFLK
jgi:DNA helicase-2/ATP-dependent DNA helicase PcrA